MRTAFIHRTLVLCAGLAAAILCPSISAAAAEGIIADYKIEPLDTINVDVFGETNLCRECKVQANGEISYPLLTNVVMAGHTTKQAENKLKELLGKDYLVNPQVTVTVKTYRVRTITVIGEVNKPGALIIPEEQKWSIPEAIGQAGGFTKLAKRSKLEFTRNGVLQTLNFEQLLKELKDPGKIVWLQPGDLINVPQTTF